MLLQKDMFKDINFQLLFCFIFTSFSVKIFFFFLMFGYSVQPVLENSFGMSLSSMQSNGKIGSMTVCSVHFSSLIENTSCMLNYLNGCCYTDWSLRAFWICNFFEHNSCVTAAWFLLNKRRNLLGMFILQTMDRSVTTLLLFC